MIDIDTFSMSFPNGKIFCVGRKKDIDVIRIYFDNRTKNEPVNTYKLLNISIKNKIYMCIMANNIRDKILDKNVISLLKKNKLLISVDAYIEAKCFSEKGEKEVMEIFNLSKDEVADIVKNSHWNKVLK